MASGVGSGVDAGVGSGVAVAPGVGDGSPPPSMMRSSTRSPSSQMGTDTCQVMVPVPESSVAAPPLRIREVVPSSSMNSRANWDLPGDQP